MGRLSNKSILFTAQTILILAISFVWLLGLAQKYAGSVSLGEWRELQLQDTKFGQGQIGARGADGNTLVAFFLNEEKSKTAIIAIDLVSGAVQPITKILYKALPEVNAQRIKNIRFADRRVVWVENTLPSNVVENPDSSDVIQELHIYDLDTATENVVPVPGDIFGLHYKEGTIILEGVIDNIGGIHAYDIHQERFFLVEATAQWHLPVLPYACDNEQAIYYVIDSEDKYKGGLYLHNFNSGTLIQLDTIYLPQNMSSDFTRYVCDEQRVIWVATDSSDRTEYLQIYNLETSQQEALTIPNKPKIYSIKFGGNVIGTRLGRQQSIGYDLEKSKFFYVNHEPSLYINAQGNPAEIITDNYWIQIQHFDGVPKIMVAPINRDL